MNLNACSSGDPGGAGIFLYQWVISLPTGAVSIPTSSCATQVSLPQGSVPVSLTVTTNDGRSASTAKSVVVKNYLIVSLGDSYASGEGNPLRPVVVNVGSGSTPASVKTPAFWGSPSDNACHRSANAGAARAALAIERADPRTSVTFISEACSGARIAHLVDTPYGGPEAWRNNTATNPPQIQSIKDLLCPAGSGFPANCQPRDMPRIDALLVSIGGNDIGFADIIYKCTVGGDLLGINSSCSTDTAFITGVANATNLLVLDDPSQNTYRKLSDAFLTVNYQNVYITEYPDSTHNDGGGICNDFTLEGAEGPFDGIIGQDDLIWASGMVHNLDSKIQTAAENFAWNYVGGISNLFSTHGYCAVAHWIEHYGESQALMFSDNGTLHPNASGQVAYAQQIVSALNGRSIGTTNASAFIPTGNVLPIAVVP